MKFHSIATNRTISLFLLMLLGWLSIPFQASAYRDLETGVFITRDPAGLKDGPNLYAYVQQNPWTKFDPNGLAAQYLGNNGEVASAAQMQAQEQRRAMDNYPGLSAGRIASSMATGVVALGVMGFVAPAIEAVAASNSLYVGLTAAANTPAIVAGTGAAVTGAVVYHETHDPVAAITSAGLMGIDAYAQGAFGGGKSNANPSGQSAKTINSLSQSAANSGAKIPQSARDVLAHVEANGAAPPGFKGGQTFANDGRKGGQILPKADATGNPITYNEFDVNPYTKGMNRGAERVVRGSDGSAHYTDDHYGTFTPIK